jgi:hypothetical protein
LFLRYGGRSAHIRHLQVTRFDPHDGCGVFQQNKCLPKPAKQIGWAGQADFGANFILLIRRKALSSAGFAKVDFAKSCFQRT